MKKSKIIFALIIVWVCLFALSACGDDVDITDSTAHVCEGEEWVVERQPTCAKTGVRYLMCSCGERVAEESIPRLEHSVKTTSGHASTCTELGLTDGKTCTVCDAELAVQRKTPALSHSYRNNRCVRCDVMASQGLEFRSNGDGTCALIGMGSCTDSVLNIPEASPAGDRVVSISSGYYTGSAGFEQNEIITMITVPDSVESIERSVFEECNSLKKVVIGNGVKTIYGEAFSYCYFLESVSLGSVKTLDSYVFLDCFSLNEVCLGNSIETIDWGVFYRCDIEEIYIPKSVTYIGSLAFYNCPLKSVFIPASVTQIVQGAFRYCEKLESIEVDRGNSEYYSLGNCIIKKKDKVLFEGCNASVIPQNEGITKISGCAFFRCEKITEVTIPDTVVSIGDSAFNECIALKRLKLGCSLETIGEDAFAMCVRLESVVIPASVTSIQAWAFEDCERLASVVFENTSGWIYAENSYSTTGESLTLGTPRQNARMLTGTHYYCHFMRV